ncbi:MAG: UDP-N-acetylmuramoyl-L-alanyl-D-glutamate--2,6-diaminopimelate ligase [Clostridiales bacterium]|nr:UDP-N-acetylmuramoyl-L-alanyl-D-glutamate--2,6-diaminopimelate ligase [Clostridiales bacterium]
MLLSQLLKDVEIAEPFKDVEIRFITDNSQNVTVGCAFVCIEGTHNDGHLFARLALSKGAKVIICERNLNLENQIIVKNSKKAYAKMCSAFFGYPSEKLNLFAITGTNGKTTTAFLLKNIIEANGEKCGLIGTVKEMAGDVSFSSQYTTPDAFQLQCLFNKMVLRGCSCCVMEASSQALSQGRLDGCSFKSAIFTNITQDHLDYHKSFEEYLKAKKRLFYKTKTAVINIDDSNSSIMAEALTCEVVSYSAQTNNAVFTADDILYSPDSVSYKLIYKGKGYPVKVNMPGIFSVYNSLSALACAISYGFDIEKCVEAVSKSKGVSGRAEIVPTKTDYNVMIDYAHSPDSLENILKTIKQYSRGRIITVFGCGGDRDKSKRAIMGRVAADLSDIAIVTSDNPRTEKPEAIIDDIKKGIEQSGKNNALFITDRREAISKALNIAQKDDVVLLAGKGHETYQILGEEKIHFDEREVIAELLNGNNQNE